MFRNIRVDQLVGIVTADARNCGHAPPFAGRTGAGLGFRAAAVQMWGTRSTHSLRPRVADAKSVPVVAGTDFRLFSGFFSGFFSLKRHFSAHKRQDPPDSRNCTG